jgi:hypothetical protein
VSNSGKKKKHERGRVILSISAMAEMVNYRSENHCYENKSLSAIHRLQ